MLNPTAYITQPYAPQMAQLFKIVFIIIDPTSPLSSPGDIQYMKPETS